MEINNQILDEFYKKYANSNWIAKRNVVEASFKNLKVINSINIGITVAVVDFVYSTQITKFKKHITFAEMVDKIINLDVINRTKVYDDKIVGELADCNSINLFSFASKYCSLCNRYLHNKDDYSMYDKRVKTFLPKCVKHMRKNNSNIKALKKQDIINYRRYRFIWQCCTQQIFTHRYR